jgi:putative hydrolase of the HAD superfamily
LDRMELVLFDLDDTLYPELEYVYSGFWHVSRCLFNANDEREKVYQRMVEFFDEDRGHVFDNLAREISARKSVLFPLKQEDSTLVSWMINEYRAHVPEIKLDQGTISILEMLKKHGLKIGLITDGIAAVQKRKVEALGVRDLIDYVIYTDDLAPNREYWKPSPYPFELALKYASVKPANACYIGDNPSKDFDGPSKLGMYTVWLRRDSGVYSCARITTKPDFEVRSLLEIRDIPIFKLFGDASCL